jgi:hypothetical protein
MSTIQLNTAIIFLPRLPLVSGSSLKRHWANVLTILFVGCSLMMKAGGHAEEWVIQKKQKSSQVGAWLKHQPVEFIENRGQMTDVNLKPAPYLLFKAEAPGIDVYITKSGISYVFLEVEENEHRWFKWRKDDALERDDHEKIRFEKLDMVLKGASIKKENIIREDSNAAEYNFLRNPINQSIKHVKKYKKITIQNVYPGIDWVLYNAATTGFKYDFVVHEGADPSMIKLDYCSLRPLELTSEGKLRVKTSHGFLEENVPYSYLSETHQKVNSRFKILDAHKQNGIFHSTVSFEGVRLNEWSAYNDLIIDPQLVWSTFISGNSYEGTTSIDSDAQGNVIITGYGPSSNYPLLNTGTYFQSTPSLGFITKFDNNGVLLWSTFFGSNVTTAFLDIDSNNNLYVCGNTSGTLLPTVNPGSAYFQPTAAGNGDAFIAKFDNAGNLLWSTYYGGSGPDAATSVSTDLIGNVFLVGTTSSTNFPLQNAGTYFQGNFAGTPNAFIIKFNPSGSRLWATYFKGINAPVVNNDLNGNVYLAASSNNSNVPVFNPGAPAYYQATINGSIDAVMAKFDNSGNQLWTTYFGGSGFEQGLSIDTDKFGNLFVTGYTNSSDLPLQNAGTYWQSAISSTLTTDVFVCKFNSNGSLLWSTYFGGTRNEVMSSNENLEVDTCGNVYIAMQTYSRNTPLQLPCGGSYFKTTLDTSVLMNYSDIFMTCFSNTGVYRWGTYFGGDGNDFRSSLCVDSHQNVFVTGEWCFATSPNSYPIFGPSPLTFTQSNLFSDDIYIAKFSNSLLSSQTFTYGSFCTSDTSQTPFLPQGFQAGGTYSSTSGLSLNNQTGKINPSLSAPGVYTVNYIQQPCFCQGLLPVTTGTGVVTIQSAPALTISGATFACIGEARSYQASGASTYSWSNGLQSPSFTITTAVAGTLNYTVTGFSTNGCVSKLPLNINVSKCTDEEELNYSGVVLKVFPNPNTGEFEMSTQNALELLLMDASGKLIGEYKLSSENNYRMVVRDLKPGFYLLREKNASSQQAYKIIVLED